MTNVAGVPSLNNMSRASLPNNGSRSNTGSDSASDIQPSKLLTFPTEILESIISYLPRSRGPSQELLAVSTTSYVLWQIARVHILRSLCVRDSLALARALDIVQGMLESERELIHHLTITCRMSELANNESLPVLWGLLPRLQQLWIFNSGSRHIPWAFRGLQSVMALTSLSLAGVTDHDIAALVSIIPDLPCLRRLEILTVAGGFDPYPNLDQTPASGEGSARAVLEDPVDPIPIPVLVVGDELDLRMLFVDKKLRPSSLFINGGVEPNLIQYLSGSLKCLALKPFRRYPAAPKIFTLDPPLRRLNISSLKGLELDAAVMRLEGCIGDFPLLRSVETLVLSIRHQYARLPLGLDTQTLRARFQHLPRLSYVMVSGVVEESGERYVGELREALGGLPVRVESTWKKDLDLLGYVEEGYGKVLLRRIRVNSLEGGQIGPVTVRGATIQNYHQYKL